MSAPLDIRGYVELLRGICDVLRPFAHPDLCKPTPGVRTPDQPLYMRDGAVLKLGDFQLAAGWLVGLEAAIKLADARLENPSLPDPVSLGDAAPVSYQRRVRHPTPTGGRYEWHEATREEYESRRGGTFFEYRALYERPHPAEPKAGSWVCDACGQKNSEWATSCGRCERVRDQPDPEPPSKLVVTTTSKPVDGDPADRKSVV